MGYTNALSWSYSRAKAFRGCPRAFFFEYYFRGEDQIERRANVVRKLSSPDFLVGQAVDWQIRSALDRVRRNEQIPSDLASCGIAAFRNQLKRSPILAQKMRWKAQVPPPNSQVMRGHFYSEPEDPTKIAACEARIEAYISNWADSELLARVLEAPPTQWAPTQADSDFTVTKWLLGDLTVYSAIDFWFENQEQIYIIDWKASHPHEKSVSEAIQQFGGYALWAARERGFAADRIFTQAAFLTSPPPWQPQQSSAEELRAAETMILAQHTAEKKTLAERILEDGSISYQASIEDYPPTPEVKRCHECKFRIMCPVGKEIVAPYLSEAVPFGSQGPGI